MKTPTPPPVYALNIQAARGEWRAWIEKADPETLAALKAAGCQSFLDPEDFDEQPFEHQENHIVNSTANAEATVMRLISEECRLSEKVAMNVANRLGEEGVLQCGDAGQKIREIIRFVLEDFDRFRPRAMAVAWIMELTMEAGIFDQAQAANVARCTLADLETAIKEAGERVAHLDNTHHYPKEKIVGWITEDTDEGAAEDIYTILETEKILTTGNETKAVRDLVAWMLVPSKNLRVRCLALALHSGLAKDLGYESEAEAARQNKTYRQLVNKLKMELVEHVGDLSFAFRRPNHEREMYSRIQREKHWRRGDVSTAIEKHISLGRRTGHELAR